MIASSCRARGRKRRGFTPSPCERWPRWVWTWDWVITVCDAANEACPVFPGARHRLHWSFEDPSRATGTDEAQLAVFRRVRDEIRATLAGWLAERGPAVTITRRTP